jgi:hypothetical protein
MRSHAARKEICCSSFIANATREDHVLGQRMFKRICGGESYALACRTVDLCPGIAWSTPCSAKE